MNRRIRRVLRLAVGWAFILLGIAGLFLPVLQGILFLLIGLFILAPEYVWAQKLLHRLRTRFPGIFEKAHAAHMKIEEKLHSFFHRNRTQPEPRKHPDNISH